MSGKNITLLKDLCDDFKKDIVDGPFGANLKREHYKSYGIPVLKIQNIKPFAITLKKMDYVDPDKYEELKRHSYQSGDIIMTKLGDPLGESAIAEGIDDGLIVADLVRIRANKVDTRYLCYHLNSPVTQTFINEQQKGTTRPRVRISVVRELPIFTPPLPEQKRIVAILDKAFAAIDEAKAKTERNLKNARELFDSYLQQVFSQRGEGWVEAPLGSVCNFQNGYAFKSKDTVESSNTQLIRMGNLYQNVLDLNRKSVFYPDSFYDEYGQFQLLEGDMIISLTGTVGKEDYGYTVEIPATDKNLLLNQRIAKIIDVDNDKLEQRFLLRILRSRAFLDELYSTANGTRQANLSTATMKEILIAFPSINKQSELCRKFGSLELETMKLVKIYTSKLESLEELKKSLLQKAFSGELTPNQAEEAVA